MASTNPRPKKAASRRLNPSTSRRAPFSPFSFKRDDVQIIGRVTSIAAPYQVEGKIGDCRFYFRMRGNEFSFGISEEFSNHSSPLRIAMARGHYSQHGTYPGNPSERKSLKLLEGCVDRYLAARPSFEPVYQHRVIAFVDILGFKSLIMKSKAHDEILSSTIRALMDVQHELIDHPNSEFQRFVRDQFAQLDDTDFKTVVTQVSDSIIISKLAHVDGAVQDLVIDVSFLTHLLLEHNLLVRGAIRLGQVIHNDRFIVGPGYIKAFQAERDLAEPTVTLDVAVMTLAKRKPNDDPRLIRHFSNHVVRADATRKSLTPKAKKGAVASLHYLDYFNDYSENIDARVTPKEHGAKLRRLIVAGLKKADNESLRSKYRWMAERFNVSDIVLAKILRPVPLPDEPETGSSA